MEFGPEVEDAKKNDYAGRASANSPEWPEIFTLPNVPRVRHPATGQPYKVSRQLVDWKQPWNLKESYLVEHSDKPEQIRGTIVAPNWRETAQFQNCSLYGPGMPEYHETRVDLMRNYPEEMFSDPNTPLLKDLIRARELRQNVNSSNSSNSAVSSQGQIRRPSTACARSVVSSSTGGIKTRPSTAGAEWRSRPSTAQESGQDMKAWARLSPNMKLKKPNVDSEIQVNNKKKQQPGRLSNAWEEAVHEVRANVIVPSSLRFPPESRSVSLYKSQNSISSVWKSSSMCALAREDSELKAISKHTASGLLKKVDVPLHGELRTKNSQAMKLQKSRKKLAREVGLVRDLL